MACPNDAAITVTRGQLIAAFGTWNDEAAREGLCTRPSDEKIAEQVDFLMYLCREQGAK